MKYFFGFRFEALFVALGTVSSLLTITGAARAQGYEPPNSLQWPLYAANPSLPKERNGGPGLTDPRPAIGNVMGEFQDYSGSQPYLHSGTDIRGVVNDPIVAVADGYVWMKANFDSDLCTTATNCRFYVAGTDKLNPGSIGTTDFYASVLFSAPLSSSTSYTVTDGEQHHAVFTNSWGQPGAWNAGGEVDGLYRVSVETRDQAGNRAANSRLVFVNNTGSLATNYRDAYIRDNSVETGALPSTLAMIDSTDDPLRLTVDQVASDNNLAQLNLQVDAVSFSIRNPEPEPQEIELDFRCNAFPINTPGGKVEIRVESHPALLAAWANAEDVTITEDGSELVIRYELCNVRLPPVTLPGGTLLPASAELVLPPNVFGSYTVNFSEYVGGQQVGGMSFNVSREDEPPVPH